MNLDLRHMRPVCHLRKHGKQSDVASVITSFGVFEMEQLQTELYLFIPADERTELPQPLFNFPINHWSHSS